MCAESSKVWVRNHQDNYFLIIITCRNDANMIKWPRAAIFARVVEDDLKLFCDVFH